MLVESFVAASSAPPGLTAANASQIKDAGIFLHTLQPQPSLRSTFKKSAAAPNCVAISDSHVFAAQKDKASVHVYNREKGSQEATIPYPEKINSIVLTCKGTLLVAGTEGGRLIAWDTTSGRLLSTSASHLQAVNVLAADSGRFVLSGSGDATVLVWSLVDLLSFPTSDSGRNSGNARAALSGHTAAITALAVGSSASTANIAVSASRDDTMIVWDYVSASKLRTVLLDAPAIATVLDVADRAIYTGYEDGSVQRIDFYDTSASTSSSVRALEPTSAPMHPSAKSRWPYPEANNNSDAPSTLSLTLSNDGTRLLSGHANGAVNHWDVTNGQFGGSLALYSGAPITNLHMLPISGFPRAGAAHATSCNVTKPRPHEEFSDLAGGRMTEAFILNVPLPRRERSSRVTYTPTDTLSALQATGFPPELIGAGFATLSQPPVPAPAQNSNDTGTSAMDTDADFVPVIDSLKEKTTDSKAWMEQFRAALDAKDMVIEKLQREAAVRAAREQETIVRRAKRVSRREARHERAWRGFMVNGQSNGRGAQEQAGGDVSAGGADAYDESSDVLSEDFGDD